MALTIACPGCERRLQLPEQFHGETVKCPSCQLTFPAAQARPATPVTRSPNTDKVPILDRWASDDDGRRPFDRPLRRSAPPPRKRGAVGTAFLVVALVLIAGGVLAGGIAFIPTLVARPGVTMKAAGPQPTFPAAGDPLPQIVFPERQSDKELEKELGVLFNDLGAAIRQGKGEGIVAYFDLERMIQEFAAQSATPVNLNANDLRTAASNGRAAFAASLQRQAAALRWNDTEIRGVKRLNATEVVVTARHTQPDQPTKKLRWWLTCRQGPWKVYDFESVELAIRMSTTAAAAMDQAPGLINADELRQAVKILVEAAQLAGVGRNPLGAEQKLRQIESVKLPKPLEALRQVVVALVRLADKHPQEALVALNKALVLNPDMPLVDLLRGIAYNQLGQWDKARKHLETYQSLMGDEAGVCFQLGETARNQERYAEAAVLYRKSLDLQPRQGEAFRDLLHCLTGAEDNADLGPRFAKLDDRRDQFDALAADCDNRKIPRLLEPIAETMYQLEPDYAPAAYRVALLRAQLHFGEKAAEPFKTALSKQTDDRLRAEYTTNFLKEMAAVGKYADAYALAPDAVAAFHLLAAEAMKGYRTDEMHRLVNVHAKEHAGDLLLSLYRAEVWTREGRYALADKEFTTALLRPLSDEALKPFRQSRVLARYHTGHALEAYREIEPRAETFPQLATLALANENNDELRALLDEHAKNDPDSIDLLCYRCRLKIRQGDVPEGVALFKKLLVKDLDDKKRSATLYEILSEFVQVGRTLDGYQATADAKESFQILVYELEDEDRHADLPPLLAAHREREPNDPLLAYYEGQAHLEAKEWDQAVKVLGDGMKRAPKEMRHRFKWSYLSAMANAGRTLEAYEEVEPRNETFSQLASLLATDKKADDLTKLVAAHRKHAVNDPNLYFYDALARVLLGKEDGAAPLIRMAFTLQKADYERRGYASRFLVAMEQAGKPLEGFRAIPDSALAFDVLASQLNTGKKDKELAALLDEYGKEHAAEPLWQYYTGEQQLKQGDAAAATKSFAAALAAAKPREDWRYRNGLYRARVKLGQVTAVYKLFGPESFVQLAGLCLETKDAKQLQALVDAHRQARPDDTQLPDWDLEIRWLKQDYEGVLKLLDEQREEVFDLPRNRWKADGYRVRSLVRLKRTKDAVREAEPFLKTSTGNRLLAMVAYAADGNVKQVIAVLDKQHPTEYLLRSYYKDEDLGPLLRSEAFKELRDKFPEPKPEPDAIDPDDD